MGRKAGRQPHQSVRLIVIWGKNAAFLPIGTPIYEVKGYRHDFLLIAGNVLYLATHNDNAKFVKDLYDIAGKVKSIEVFRDTHNKDIRLIESDRVERIVALYLEREIVGIPAIFATGVPKTDFQYFIRFNLHDGVSVSTIYQSGSEVMGPGIRLGAELQQELKSFIKQAFNQ